MERRVSVWRVKGGSFKWGGQKRLAEKGALSKAPGRRGCGHEEICGNREKYRCHVKK